jgi:hypothetical protein
MSMEQTNDLSQLHGATALIHTYIGMALIATMRLVNDKFHDIVK